MKIKRSFTHLLLISTITIAVWFQLGFHQKQQQNSTALFTHHYVDTTLPLKENGIGDYGVTTLVDIDQDGKLDFVLGSKQFSTLHWYQYKSAGQWERHVVGTDYLSDVGLAHLDVDRDGRVDLVCSGVWYRNTGKPRTEQFERIVFDDTASGAHDILTADMDSDGIPDIVMMGDERTQLNGVYWYKIPADKRQPWEKHFIGLPVHGAIAPAGVGDINGDGYPDIVRAGAWFENKGGKGTEWVMHENIPMGRKGPFGFCVRTAIADMDHNGKKVIVMCDADIVDSKMVILRSPDGKGSSWIKQELPQSFSYGSLHSLAVADFNNDGLLDIVANEQEELMPTGRQNPRWILWTNLGNQKYAERIILDAAIGGHELQVGDVDGDGDIDICSKAWGTAPWNSLGGKMHVDFLENISRR